MKRFKDILYMVEPGKECRPALERAVLLAENNQANLTVITAAPSNKGDGGNII
jgi:universal stress protein E